MLYLYFNQVGRYRTMSTYDEPPAGVSFSPQLMPEVGAERSLNDFSASSSEEDGGDNSDNEADLERCIRLTLKSQVQSLRLK